MMDSSKIKLERYAQRKDKTVEWKNMVMGHLDEAFKEIFKTEVKILGSEEDSILSTFSLSKRRFSRARILPIL